MTPCPTLVHVVDTVDTPNCQHCGHAAHGESSCQACAGTNSTCWQRPRIVSGDGDREAGGKIDLATGLEQRPCCVCRSFEKDSSRLQRHIIAKGLIVDGDGNFETPIAKDFKGRRSLKLNLHNFGWCRRNAEVVDALATCPAWKPVRTSSELESRIKS